MLIFKLTKATLKALNKANNNKKGILSSWKFIPFENYKF